MHIYKIFTYAALYTALATSTLTAGKVGATVNFTTWQQICDELPRQRYNTDRPHTTPLDPADFLWLLETFKQIMREQLDDDALWLTQPTHELLATQTDTFTPYVQKLALDDHAICAVHGDLHGDVHATNDFITYLTQEGYIGGNDGFTIIHDNFYMLFLGDYVDRGWYGAEVIYTIMRLKIANPERVILVRGNHEDASLNSRYGFEKELNTKFKSFHSYERQQIYALYNYLPVALFLGSTRTQEYLLCCHGGIEIGYNPQALLDDPRAVLCQQITTLKQKTYVATLPTDIQNYFALELEQLADFKPTSPTRPHHLGFMWNDFMTQSKEPHLTYKPGRGFKFGKKPTKGILKYLYSSNTAHVCGVFRAHQHGDKKMMASILNTDGKSPDGDTGISKLWRPLLMHYTSSKLWKGIVCTFLVTPGSAGKHFDFAYDAFGLLQMRGKFTNWKLKAVRI